MVRVINLRDTRRRTVGKLSIMERIRDFAALHKRGEDWRVIQGLAEQGLKEDETKNQALRDLVAAADRLLSLDGDCDYVDGTPGVCPGIQERGVACHWCELRAAKAHAEEMLK